MFGVRLPPALGQHELRPRSSSDDVPPGRRCPTSCRLPVQSGDSLIGTVDSLSKVELSGRGSREGLRRLRHPRIGQVGLEPPPTCSMWRTLWNRRRLGL